MNSRTTCMANRLAITEQDRGGLLTARRPAGSLSSDMGRELPWWWPEGI